MQTKYTDQLAMTALPEEATEKDLCKRLVAGEDKAYGELYDIYAGKLYKVAYGILGNPSEAQDAVQETFIALARYRYRLTGISNLRAYLYTMLRREASRVGIRRSKHKQMMEELSNEPVDSCKDDGGHQLRQSLGFLPEDQLTVVTLKFGAGMTFAEIAEILEVSQNTVASRYRYALQKIKTKRGSIS